MPDCNPVDCADSGQDDSFLFPALDPGCEISAAAFAMKPHHRGGVRLRSSDPTFPLEIEHGFGLVRRRSPSAWPS